MTPESRFDLIVIGSGPAGQRAALQGAKGGKRVVIIEDQPLVGGACVHQGTIPSKSLRESIYRYGLSSRGALGAELGEESSSSGKPAEKKKQLPDLKRLWRRRDRVIPNESAVIQDQLRRNGVLVVHGRGRLTGPNSVEVKSQTGTQHLEGQFIFVATGASPVCSPQLRADAPGLILDSNTLLGMKRLPRTLVVLGAGVIGAEYASMFSIAGTQVTLVDKRTEVLASVDREVAAQLIQRLEHDGAKIALGCEATKIEARKKRGSDEYTARVHLSNGTVVDAEKVLVCLGRAGNTAGLGLQELGIQVDDRGLVKVDRHFATSIPSIYAVGDVVGSPALAATSYEQGRIACGHAFDFDREGKAVELEMPVNFPYGIYTIPEISMIGKTEEQLRAEGANFVVGRARYRELARGQIVGDRWGLLKLLVDRDTLRILGVHIIGDNAADLIHIGQAVMAFDGDVRYFIRSVFNYPTLAEAYKTAAFHAYNQIHGLTRHK